MIDRQHGMTTTRPRPPAGHNAALFILGALLCAGAVFLTYFLFVRTATGQFVDESAWAEADAAADATRAPFLQFLDNLPLFSVFLATAVVLFVTIARRRWLAAVAAIGTMAGANLSTQVLKNLLFDRPDRGVPTLDFNSLPSGHTTFAASAAAAVFLVVTPRWRPLAAAVGGSYAVVAGAATLINLWHRPADIIAAFLVVAAWTMLGGLLILRTGDDWNVWSGFGEHWAASRFWLRFCWLLGLAGCAVSAGLYALAEWSGPAPVPGDGSVPLFYWAGLALIVGVGFVLSALGCWVFARQARIRR